jgi:hypothetical protein
VKQASDWFLQRKSASECALFDAGRDDGPGSALVASRRHVFAIHIDHSKLCYFGGERETEKNAALVGRKEGRAMLQPTRLMRSSLGPYCV